MKNRIYLDIDGVLNSYEGDQLAKEKFPEDWAKTHEDNWLKHKDLFHKFWYPKAMDNFKNLIEKSDPEIYIHSTWKNHFDLDELKSFFENWGISGDIFVGIVPQYKFSSERVHNLSWHIKGQRIRTDDVNPVENYVILDDADMRHSLENVSSHLVYVNGSIGLSEKDVTQALDILRIK